MEVPESKPRVPKERSGADRGSERSSRPIEVQAEHLIERILTLEIVRVTERAAVSAARFRGLGNEVNADRAAVDAMRRELAKLPIDGTVVIGEGERDEAPMLFIGEKVGTSIGPEMDIAIDPLEGTTLCAKGLPGAITVIAIAERGTLLHAPDVYMEKIAVGPGYPAGIVDLDAPVAGNIASVAREKRGPTRGDHSTRPRSSTACRLDRCSSTGWGRRSPHHRWRYRRRHPHCRPDATEIDVYMGIGGAPEGVLAAAALRCIGGQMQARLVLNRPEARVRAEGMGILDPRKKYRIEDMVKGDCLFAATGVTDGSMLRGVRFRKNVIETETLVMRSTTGTLRRRQSRAPPVRKIRAELN